MEKKNIWGIVIQTLITILTAIGTTLGVTSCQIARYLPHHRSENASKTHPKSSHDKFKTASYFYLHYSIIHIIFCQQKKFPKM